MKQAATLFYPVFLFSGLHLSSAVPPVSIDKPLQVLEASRSPQDTIPLTGHIPAESLYQILAAEMALDRDHPEIALANYIAAAKETQDAAIASRATQIALSIASLEVAVEPAVIWATADKNNLEAQITTAALFIRLNQIPKAVSFLKRTERLNEEEAYQYFLILFRQLQKDDDSKRVVTALENLIKEETSVASAHLALAEIYLYQGQEATGLAMSEAALKINPKSVVAIQLYTESLLRTKDKAAAKAFLDKKAAESPQNTLLHQYYSQFLLENGFNDNARKEITQLIQNPHLTAEELLQFARMSMQAQWFDLAETVLNRARQLPDNKDLAHYFLARLAEIQNKEEVAIEWFKQVLTGPFHVLSQVRASILLTEKKRYTEALTILSHTHPNDLSDKKQIVLATVDIFNKEKRYPEAFELLNENIKLMPDELELRYARSLVADNLDKLDIAEADLKAILAVSPKDLNALNALGFMLANKTRRYDEAQAFLSNALKLSPNNASVLDSLGWLYYKMGNYNQSIEVLQKAAAIMPDAEISAHLGEVLWQTKDFAGAKRVWKTALEHHPQHENILKVMQRLIPQEQ